MLTIERVICLKAVPMFAGVSEEILADVAELLEEVEVAAGEVVFEKGAAGDSMYVVVDGQRAGVRRRRAPSPARASARSSASWPCSTPSRASPPSRPSSDTRLFRLDREAFSELMAGNIEIVRGVLHVLCERLRATGRDPAGDRRRAGQRGRSG